MQRATDTLLKDPRWSFRRRDRKPRELFAKPGLHVWMGMKRNMLLGAICQDVMEGKYEGTRTLIYCKHEGKARSVWLSTWRRSVRRVGPMKLITGRQIVS